MRLSILVFVASSACGQGPPPSAELTEAARATEAAAIAKKAAASYRLTTGKPPGGTVLAARAEVAAASGRIPWVARSTARYSSGRRGGGRRWSPRSTKSTCRFPSILGRIPLAERGPATAERDGHAEWSPVRGGVEFRPLPGAPAPADTPARRLRQMRALAVEFSATKTDRKAITPPAPPAHPADLWL